MKPLKPILEFFKSQLKKATDVWDFIIQSQLKIHDINTHQRQKRSFKCGFTFFSQNKKFSC